LRHKRDLAESNRRQWPRLKPEAVPFLKSVDFNQGSEVRVIDISRGGVLLETEVRLNPQMKITLKLVTTEGVVKLEGLILRSSIASLTGAPKYRSAISFAHPFHMLDDLSAASDELEQALRSGAASPAIHDMSGDQPLMDPDSGCGIPQNEEPAILTMIAHDGVSLQDLFKLNDW
jgi:hypothetical protein